ncbi:hypothetical protein [Kitasatospora aureofaciens]|uniref:hypothetical protein n=1 Tax=Kitasatospora aureofaciens TaxID=1894 RepID=UPI003816347B
MTGSLVRPAGPPDADELLRLRVAVLDGAQLTDDWRATEAGSPALPRPRVRPRLRLHDAAARPGGVAAVSGFDLDAYVERTRDGPWPCARAAHGHSAPGGG